MIPNMLATLAVDPLPWVGGGALGLAAWLAFRWLNTIISERQDMSRENRDRRKDDHDWFDEALKSRDTEIKKLRDDHEALRVVHETDLQHFRERIEESERRERVCQARLSDLEREVTTFRNLLKVDQREE